MMVKVMVKEGGYFNAAVTSNCTIQKRWKESERVQEEGKSDAAIIKTTKITITLKMKHKEKLREIFELVEEKKWEWDADASPL